MTNILNKRFWTQIQKLKSLNTPDAQTRFSLDYSPFDDDDDDTNIDGVSKANEHARVIRGRIFPNSEIYREAAFLIEIRVGNTFPLDKPEVRFLTPIYHPNVDKSGVFCNDLLRQWIYDTSLIDLVTSVIHYIDWPKIESSANFELGYEYMNQKSEFDRKAREWVKKHGLPRF